MLQSLSISNYALIDSLYIQFENGFNIITGETGAGKSIILGALGLIIGQRADTTVLRDKTRKCVVEGTFAVRGYGLELFFEDEELDFEDTVILRREITVSGNTRAFINDTPVNVRTLRDLGLRLVDIHSQHQNLELGNNHFQLKLVDLVAGNAGLLKEYVKNYSCYRKTQAELNELEELAAQSKTDLDYYEFQFKQLEDARLQENEQFELEEEAEVLSHAEEIQFSFGKIAHELEGEELNILSRIKEMLAQINRIKGYFGNAGELYNRLESCYLELKDIASESAMISEKTGSNPERLELVSRRLDLIYSLQQKHRVTSIAGLIEIYQDLNDKIRQMNSYDEQIKKLKAGLQQLHGELDNQCVLLREARKQVAGTIAGKVISVLRELGMPNANFSVRFAETDDFTLSGTDEVNFLFSANKNSTPEDISKVASGGEMSRLMLAIKTLVTDTKALPTIIFDEIDAGISGEIAVKTGQIISRLSETVQVINITHLPQIAAKGSHHYFVYKYDENDRTHTSIRKLDEQERVVELAKMLSGENYSETALEAARELLN
ncbi:MAG: DNA repair protein RecN [Prolixibacteraceae bacterium]|nr:DNA repair protein RecN [Prolixibacteraceae bacterium]